MIDYILTLLLILFGVYHYMYVRETNAYIKTLIKAIMAKDLTDFTISDRQVSKSKVEEEQPKEEYVSIADANEDTFRKMINRTLGKDNK